MDLRLLSWWVSYDNRGGGGTSSNSVYTLPVYSGNKMRAKDAKPFDLKQGEERSGEDIQIPISQLHTVRGTVTAARDGHGLNGGQVALLYPDDKSPVSQTSVTSDAEFDFNFVPEGDYLLNVNGATDTDYREIPNCQGCIPPVRTESHTLKSYGMAEVPIHVGNNDITGVVISVPDLQKTTSGN